MSEWNAKLGAFVGGGGGRGDMPASITVTGGATPPARPSYAELEAIVEQVRAFARQPDARVEDGFDKQFVAGDASCRRGLRKIPGIGDA